MTYLECIKLYLLDLPAHRIDQSRPLRRHSHEKKCERMDIRTNVRKTDRCIDWHEDYYRPPAKSGLCGLGTLDNIMVDANAIVYTLIRCAHCTNIVEYIKRTEYTR